MRGARQELLRTLGNKILQGRNHEIKIIEGPLIECNINEREGFPQLRRDLVGEVCQERQDIQGILQILDKGSVVAQNLQHQGHKLRFHALVEVGSLANALEDGGDALQALSSCHGGIVIVLPGTAVILKCDRQLRDERDGMGLNVISKFVDNDLQGGNDLIIADLRHDAEIFRQQLRKYGEEGRLSTLHLDKEAKRLAGLDLHGKGGIAQTLQDELDE